MHMGENSSNLTHRMMDSEIAIATQEIHLG